MISNILALTVKKVFQLIDHFGGLISVKAQKFASLFLYFFSLSNQLSNLSCTFPSSKTKPHFMLSRAWGMRITNQYYGNWSLKIYMHTTPASDKLHIFGSLEGMISLNVSGSKASFPLGTMSHPLNTDEGNPHYGSLWCSIWLLIILSGTLQSS